MSEWQILTLPRFTILTPCLNGARYIREAVESVRRQHYANLEHIVLDAGSTDGTIELLAGFPEVQVISEPDCGSHDAMNTGVRYASGEIIGFLNADDLYPDGLLAEVGRAFARHPTLDVVLGRTVVFEDEGRGGCKLVVARAHALEHGFWLPELTFGAPGFNGRFYRRRVFDLVGGFDLSYSFGADRDFLLKLGLRGVKSRTLPRTSYLYRAHAGSRTLNLERDKAEAFTRENLRMAPLLRELAGRHTNNGGILAAWYVYESLKLIWYSLRARRLAEALRVLRKLGLTDALWIFQFMHALALHRAVRREEMHSTSSFHEPLPGPLPGLAKTESRSSRGA